MVIERGDAPAPGTLSPEVERRVANAPPPGQAPLPAANARELLKRNAKDPEIADRPALKFGDLVITHAEFYEACVRFARCSGRGCAPTGLPTWRCCWTTRPTMSWRSVEPA